MRAATRAPVDVRDLDQSDRVDPRGERDEPGTSAGGSVPLGAREAEDGDRAWGFGPSASDLRELRKRPLGERGLEIQRRLPLAHGRVARPNAVEGVDPRAEVVLAGVQSHVTVARLPVDAPDDVHPHLEPGESFGRTPKSVDDAAGPLRDVDDLDGPPSRDGDRAPVARLAAPRRVEVRPVEDDTPRGPREDARAELADIGVLDRGEIGEFGHRGAEASCGKSPPVAAEVGTFLEGGGVGARRGTSMFKARIRTEVLRELVEVVSTLVSEVKLTVSKDGIEVKAVDPSHVAMLVLKLDGTAFEEFTGETTTIGVDMEKLKDVLRLSKPGDVLDLQYDGGKSRLVVKVGKVTRHMSVIDPAGMAEPKVPNVSPPALAVVRMEEIRQGIRGSESIADHVTIQVEPEQFSLSSEGETDRVDLHLTKGAGGKDGSGLSKLEAKEVVKSMYPLDFFSAMMKSITSADEVTLYVGNEYPLKVEFSVAGGKGSGRFLLAPRVEED